MDHPEKIIQFLKVLRETIMTSFEELEPYARFERKPWDHPSGGGGEMGILRGEIFEKAAVNFSAVSGETFPMQDGSGPYFATGISLITHMSNPHAPTVHMNLRYIQTTEKQWFGGGYDLTPMGFPYEEDKKDFHQGAKDTLDPFGEEIYPLFSKQAAEYFFIPHWKKERGVGGIFFDHFNSGNFEKDFEMWKAIGTSFIPLYIDILKKRIHKPYTRHDKEKQLVARAHYVEFNLLYDRGTQFGFKSGGNPEAILCSMPPLVKW